MSSAVGEARTPRRRMGIRSRTVIGATLAIAIALFIGAVVLRWQLRSSLATAISDRTVTRANGVAALVATGDFRRVLDTEGLTPQWVQVVDETGRVVAATANAGRLRRPFALVPSGSRTVVRRLSGLRIDTGEPVVVAFVRARSSKGRYTVLVASPLDLVDSSDRRVVGVLLLVFPALLVVSSALIWLVVRRAMRPVEAIRANVASISSSDLRRRVPHPKTNDEIGRLATTMNDMLDRLHQSNMRQRQFVADASHELRSPLASLRNQLEVSTIDNPDPLWAETVAGMITDHERLERLIHDLLLLARHDDLAPTDAEPVDLGYLVRHEMAKRPTSEAVVIDVHADNALVLGNADALIRVLRNLVDNAVRHAKTHVNVTVRSIDAPDPATVELVVLDDGEGIPKHLRAAVFERFRRLDDARTTDSGGSGLGLAIVADLVHAHGGVVEVADSAVGARFVVRLPLLTG